MELSDMAIGVPWGPKNRVPFGTLALERTSKGLLRFVDGAKTLAEVSLDLAFGEQRDFPARKQPFEPPLFGITVIGSGSGFDLNETTSGFIIWVNRRGILIDPPVDTTLWLKSMDINPRLIDDCILTHCHADHDSGILQKLLEEKKLNLRTTDTIMESFVRKYQALTGLSLKAFMNLFHFHPVTLQVPMRIHGGEFRFFYTLHPIPTIGVEVYFQGKSFVYSSDSMYDPPTVRTLFERGIINRYRMVELINFPWHHTVVFHEAGIPPIHTPIKNLAELPDSVQAKMYLIHVSEKAIPPGSLLRKAPVGPDATIVIPVTAPQSNEALEYLDVLNHIDLFSGLPIEKAREFLTLVKVERFRAGERFIEKGSAGDRFYMIVNGRARVVHGPGPDKIRSNNDYIGETSMILNAPRNADVYADTDLKVLVMDKYDFLYFIRGSEIARHMKVIAENREYDTWSLFDSAPMFKSLSSTQRTQLQGIMTRLEFAAGQYLAVEGASRRSFFLLDSGTVTLSRNKKVLLRAERGSFFGKVYASSMRGVHRFSLLATTPVVAYGIDIFDFYHFLERNPGVFLLLRDHKTIDHVVSATGPEHSK